jgi:hypothetical protein
MRSFFEFVEKAEAPASEPRLPPRYRKPRHELRASSIILCVLAVLVLALAIKAALV